jgi:hypothetical protein
MTSLDASIDIILTAEEEVEWMEELANARKPFIKKLKQRRDETTALQHSIDSNSSRYDLLFGKESKKWGLSNTGDVLTGDIIAFVGCLIAVVGGISLFVYSLTAHHHEEGTGRRIIADPDTMWSVLFATSLIWIPYGWIGCIIVGPRILSTWRLTNRILKRLKPGDAQYAMLPERDVLDNELMLFIPIPLLDMQHMHQHQHQPSAPSQYA